MNKLNEMIEELELNDQTEYVRDYNFRKQSKLKEQEKRKFIYSAGYFPTMPYEQEGENGELYYVEGSKDYYKPHLKRKAAKVVRRADLGDVGNGGHYKKLFDLPWSWY